MATAKKRVTMSPAAGLSNQGKDDSDDYEYSLERKASIHIPEWLPRRFQKTGMAQTVLPYASILVWYCFNMTVVLSNRWIFTHLPLPTSLTLLHSVPLLAVCPPHCSPPSLFAPLTVAADRTHRLHHIARH